MWTPRYGIVFNWYTWILLSAVSSSFECSQASYWIVSIHCVSESESLAFVMFLRARHDFFLCQIRNICLNMASSMVSTMTKHSTQLIDEIWRMFDAAKIETTPDGLPSSLSNFIMAIILLISMGLFAADKMASSVSILHSSEYTLCRT